MTTAANLKPPILRSSTGCLVAVLMLLATTATAFAQVPFQSPFANAPRADLVRGRSFTAEGEVIVIFTRGTVYKTLTEEGRQALVQSPRITAPSGIKVEIVRLNVRETAVRFSPYGDEYQGTGYAITCSVRITPEETAVLAEAPVEIGLPGVRATAETIDAGVGVYESGDASFRFPVRVFATQEALDAAVRAEREQKEQQEAAELTQKWLLYGSVITLAVIDVTLIVAAIMVSLRRSGTTGPVSLAPYSEVPSCCLVCGKPEAVRPAKTFYWSPVQASGVIGGLISLATMRRVTLNTPLCERHRGYWTWRSGLVVALPFFLGIGLGAAVLLWGLQNNHPTIGVIAIFEGLILGIIATSFLGGTTIAVVEMTGSHVTLKRVSLTFLRELRQLRSAEDDQPDSSAPPPPAGSRRRPPRDEPPPDPDDNPFANLR